MTQLEIKTGVLIFLLIDTTIVINGKFRSVKCLNIVRIFYFTD